MAQSHGKGTFLLAWPILLLICGQCQVFTELHYVYVPERAPSSQELSQWEAALEQSEEGSAPEAEDPSEANATPQKTGLPPGRPAWISDGRGQSLRFHWQSGQAKSGNGDGKPGGSLDLYGLDITIANPDMIRELFRAGRKEDAGRLPDLLFLELRFQNRSHESVTYDPFQVRLHCKSTDFVALPAATTSPPAAMSGESGKSRILEPLNPEDFEDQYSGISHFWLSYAWHMSPRRAAFLYRPDPASPVPRNLHRLNRNDQEQVRSSHMEFLRGLRKPARVGPQSTMILYLPFPELEPGERCTVRAPMPGTSSVSSAPFYFLRVEKEGLEKLKEANLLEDLRNPSDRPSLEDEPEAPALLGQRQRRVFLRERQEFRSRLEKEEAELKDSHIQRRRSFCQGLPSDAERERFSFCQEGILWQWFGSGF